VRIHEDHHLELLSMTSYRLAGEMLYENVIFYMVKTRRGLSSPMNGDAGTPFSSVIWWKYMRTIT
jgi:hypothetical protein